MSHVGYIPGEIALLITKSLSISKMKLVTIDVVLYFIGARRFEKKDLPLK